MKSTSWGGVGGQAELHSQECSLTFRRSFLALFACVSTLCGALSSQSCVCERRLMFVSSVWSPLLCQINVCNEANPLSTNNLIHQALIFLPPPPPFFFLLSSALRPETHHQAIWSWPEINWKHHQACRNIQSNEIWMFALGIVRRNDFLLQCRERDVFGLQAKSVYLRRLMVNLRKYQVCTCYFLCSEGSVP